jgi:hypothetical protein
MLIAPLMLMMGLQQVRYHEAPFRQDIGARYTQHQGLPSNDVQSIAVSPPYVWAGTAQGLARLWLPQSASAPSRWTKVAELTATCLLPDGSGGVYASTPNGFYRLNAQGQAAPLAGLESVEGRGMTHATQGGFWCVTPERLLRWDGKVLAAYPAPPDTELNFVMEDARGRVYAGAQVRKGGYSSGERGTEWSYVHQLLRLEGDHWVARTGIKSILWRYLDSEFQAGAADKIGHLWLATNEGLLATDGDEWWYALSGKEGLPYEATKCVTLAPNGDLWAGTTDGACRLREGRWNYFWGKRWLPGNKIRAIAVDGNEGAWLATEGGVGHIESRPITLAQKAAHYEQITAARHDRNGYVTICRLKDPEDLSDYEIEASDNDGLWTSLYAAAECFRYAATGSAEARDLARKSMHAIMDLERLSGISGYPARAVVRQGETHVFASNGLWHPSPVDPRYRWKGDTSSDELDGHFFIYPIYYDLVADAKEKEELRAVLRRIIDHLLTHNYQLIDVDGKPTTWAIFNPENLNDNPVWAEGTGLNSLSMLAYLVVAQHILGDAKYRQAYNDLVQKHHYLLNVITQKQLPPFDVNHSDDELAFLGYYTLMRYETEPEHRRVLMLSLERSWRVARPERAALFNMVYGAVSSKPCDVAETVQTLQEWPWDLRHWTIQNSQRTDIQITPDSRLTRPESVETLPYSERRVMQWSDNPFALDGGEDGLREYDGAAFLLPYWMGRYWKLLTE